MKHSRELQELQKRVSAALIRASALVAERRLAKRNHGDDGWDPFMADEAEGTKTICATGAIIVADNGVAIDCALAVVAFLGLDFSEEATVDHPALDAVQGWNDSRCTSKRKVVSVLRQTGAAVLDDSFWLTRCYHSRRFALLKCQEDVSRHPADITVYRIPRRAP